MADNSQLPQAASQITPSSTGPSSPGNGGASIRRTSPPSLSRTDAASGSPLQHSSSPSAGSEQAHGIPIDDDDDPGDSDSAVEAGSAFSDSTSLKSEIMRYRFENGRRYHSYKDGEYWGPNDEKQNNQLDIAHHLYLLTLGGKLFLVPIGDNPQMSAQPAWVAPNVQFEVNDACEAEWGYKANSFDFIHARAMYGSVADWPAFYQTVLVHLMPGGWYQQIEMSVVPTADDGSVVKDSIFDQWGKVSLEAGDKIGKDLRIHEQIKGYLEHAGFENVVERVFKWPIGPWSKDPYMKDIGLWNQVH